MLVACTLLAVSAVAMDGGLAGFLQRLSTALESARQMGIQPSIGDLVRLDRFNLNAWDWGIFILLTGTLVFSFFALDERHTQWRVPTLGLLLGTTLLALAVTSGLLPLAVDHAKFRGLLMLTVPFAAAIAAALLVRTRWASDFSWPRPALAVVITFAVAPHAYAFGTGNNYWQSASAVSIFWIFSGLAALIPAISRGSTWLRVLPLAVGAQVISLFLMHMALGHPYRQPAIHTAASQSVELGPGSTELRLDAAYAQYLGSLRRMASAAGLRSATPVIDLTGHAPGSLYALGARAVGAPWLLGGYPGSDRSAAGILSRVDCAEVAAAWVLVELDGPRHLSPSVLQKSGIRVPADFVVAGRLVTPNGFGGYPTGAEQQLLKPTRPLDDAVRACRIARGVAF